MATITRITDRSVCTCTGAAAAAYDIAVAVAEQRRAYRLREWPFQGFWQLQELQTGKSGASDLDYTDIGRFRSQQDALAYLEGLPDA